MSYRMLDAFRAMFDGSRYRHRSSTQGDRLAMELYEDLYESGKSKVFVAHVNSGEWVLNTANKRRGITARRGDGTFGEALLNQKPIVTDNYAVARGEIATVEIGVEVKVLAKSMVKQLNRVIADLNNQVLHFQRKANNPVCVGVVGINHAPFCVGYEGDREYRTDGKANRHPIDEADEVHRRIAAEAKPNFDEILVLRYRATNAPPYPFEWVDESSTERDYGAILVRIARDYDNRFGS